MRFIQVATLFFALLIQLGSVNAASTPPSKIQRYVDLYSQANVDEASSNELLQFIDKLAEKQQTVKDTRTFVGHIFEKTHRRFLKSYTEYVSFGETLKTGTYNCLTGTALYALLLDHFGVNYEVIETNYHIFLLAHTDKGDVLLEATDPQNGFVIDPSKIEERVAKYKLNSLEKSEKTKRYFAYSADLYKSVSLDEMTGLLYYNLSIVSYNRKEFAIAAEQLTQAANYYQSPRIEEFSRLLLLTILDSELEEHLKERCIKSLQAIRNTNASLSARSGR